MRALVASLLLVSCSPLAQGRPNVLIDRDAVDLGGVYPSETVSGSVVLLDLRDIGPATIVDRIDLEGAGADWIELVTDVELPTPIAGPIALDLNLVVPADEAPAPYSVRLVAVGGDGDTAFEATSRVTFDVRPCDADGDGDAVPQCGGGDCADDDDLRSSLARELCNGIDDDCNGVIDDAVDGDGDGFAVCEDCDDADPSIFPGAAERCNGLDDDCDGQVGPQERDGDGDGVSTCDGDCNDLDGQIFPGALELCNGLDDDCDGLADDREDGDADGFSVCDDCDDTDPRTYPGAPEQCDGLDNDCDGAVPAAEADADGDGVALCERDCDDADPTLFPGNRETCNGEDDNCDEVIDEGSACPCTRVEEDGDIYLFCNSPRAWTSAQTQCSSWNYHLLTVDTADEDGFALDELRDIDGSTRWWMGFNDRAREGAWVWEDGSSVRFTNWERSEPNDQGGEDCGQLNFFENGAWNDQACTLSYPFVCELD